jgi:hypothetical protein
LTTLRSSPVKLFAKRLQALAMDSCPDSDTDAAASISDLRLSGTTSDSSLSSICPHSHKPQIGSQLHPETIPNSHVSFGEFKKAVNDALEYEGGTYDEVKVLLLNWSENDIGLKKPEAGSFVLDETLKLQGIFRDLYRYDTQHYLIPSRNPEERVLQLLLDAFIELSDKQLTKKVLLIIYYNGHGTVKDHKLIWSA